MSQLYIICEGPTEEKFVKTLLVDAFSSKGIYLYPTIIGNPGHKGGNVRLERLFKDIQKLLHHPKAYCTTFFDFYGLPSEFPGKNEAQKKTNSKDKSDCLLNAFSEKLESMLDENTMRRFIPYVQMHEFEGLLFSDTKAFAKGINKIDLESAFQNIRAQFKTPEDINDSKETAPSKRIISLFSDYDKPLFAALASKEIGLDIIREECLLFDEWLKKLEKLPA